jgi:hypothetical protein
MTIQIWGSAAMLKMHKSGIENIAARFETAG